MLTVVEENKTLSPADYAVFSMVLVVSAAIGLYYACTGGKQRTTGEYLMADRKMHVLPVTCSLLASFMSAITLLGTPAEVYRFGSIYWFIWIGYLLMMPFVAHVFLPVFFRLRLTSVFEYLELRFSKGVRVCTAIAFIIQMVLYLSIVLYAPSLALSAVTGLNVWVGVFSVGVVCTFYTSIGGMKAVIWTDTLQIILMFTGLIAVLIRGSIDFNGFGNIWRIMEEGDRIEWANWDPSPLVRHTTWSLIFGGCFTWLPIFGVNQAQIQRALSVPKLKQAQLAMWLNVIGLTAILTICMLCGMVVYAEFKDCDPLTVNRIDASDQLLPLYVMDRLSHIKGLPGLFTACLFSGALSTVSSGLNSLAAVTMEDLVSGLCFKQLTDSKKTLAAKIIAVCYGAICIALTFVAAELGSVLQAALALFGMIGGPQLGLFFLGILYPCANKIGAYVGFFTGLLFAFWLGIGAQIYKTPVPLKPMSIAGCNFINSTSNTSTLMSMMSSTMEATTSAMVEPTKDPAHLDFYGISYIWYGALASGIVVAVGLIVSFISGPTKPSTVDPRLLCPVFDYFCCCLPSSLREKLRCGVDELYEEEDEEFVVKSLDSKEKSYENGASTNGYANPAPTVSDYSGPRMREKSPPYPGTYDSNAVTVTKM